MPIRILLPVSLIACTSAAVTRGPLRVSQPGDVESCVSAGVIEERIEAPTPSDGLREKAQELVYERATKLNATDIVILRDEADRDFAHVKAEAFRCKR